MKKVTRTDFMACLNAAGLKTGDNVFVHSALGHLGMVENTKPKEIPQTLYQWLLEAVGPEGGIFMPNYAYRFPKERTCDLRTQASTVGIWTEWFRTQPDSLLSGHPMFSIAGAGPNAKEICRPDVAEFSPFSEQSTFARLYERDTLMLFFGVDLACATFMVYCEQKLGLPYRFLKPFAGQCILQNGQCVEGEYAHYCYPLEGGYSADFRDFQKELKDKGLIQEQPLGMGRAFGLRMKVFFKEVEAYTNRKKWGLLTREPEFYCRFEKGREVRYPAS